MEWKSGDARGEGIRERSKELLVCCELQGNNKSCEKVEGVLNVRGVRIGRVQGKRNVLLGKGDHALWSSSCVRRKPGEGHLLALFYERDGEREGGRGRRRRGREEALFDEMSVPLCVTSPLLLGNPNPSSQWGPLPPLPSPDDHFLFFYSLFGIRLVFN